MTTPRPILRSPRLLLIIAYVGFISLGLPDTVIGVAWPSVRDTFHRPQSALAVIFACAGLSYFLSSFFTGRLLKTLGIGWLLAGSSLLVALSAAGYAAAPWWMLFATCAIFHWLGSGAIDAGLNHYVAHHFSARHMNWLHACYSLGATFGPLIMTTVLAADASWRLGYGTVAAILLSLALLFATTRRKWDANGEDDKPEKAPDAGMRATLADSTVRLQVAIFFVYTGLEVTVGQWSFTLLTEARAMPKETAGIAVTIYWASIAAGRVLFGWVVDHFGIDRLVRASTALALLGTVLLAASTVVWLSTMALAIAGLGLAAIFPCLMTRTPQRIGSSMAAHAIGFQVSAAMLGAAVLPSATGMLAERFGLASIADAAVGMAGTLWLLHEGLLRGDPPPRVRGPSDSAPTNQSGRAPLFTFRPMVCNPAPDASGIDQPNLIMKLLATSVILLGLGVFAQAGQPVISTTREYKEPVVEELCFRAGEWQFDTFGQYSFGKSGEVGAFHEHGWGGGVGFNYFFSRHIGLGIDAAWLAIREDSRFERNDPDSEHTVLHNFSGSVIFRLPIDSACLAPYAYVGGGFHVDGKQWASGHAGLGIEYRIKPDRFGIFIDGRWTYLGDRGGTEDLNFFSTRAGFRIIF